ncbi:MAG: V-type ATPase subunit [Treponema sp.]|nr:V-type ATPase subunit [Treponema sp.]
MDKEAAGAYIFAKASGILGKSFVGDRAEILFNQKNLQDLWSLLFRSHPPMVPEVLLARQIEVDSLDQFIKQYAELVYAYDNPDPILMDQLYIYEAENLKELGAALCKGEKECPSIRNLGKYSLLNYSAWPDIKAITKGSIFSWYNHVPGVHEQQEMELKVDMQVIRHLWNSVEKEKGSDYLALMKIYKNEYVIKNVVWALRLKLYYEMSDEQILEKLIYVTDGPSKKDPLAGPAIHALELPLDDYNAWAASKFCNYINPHTEGLVWTVNPSWIEKISRIQVNKLAWNTFHMYPLSVCSLISWYKIKHFELNCIRTAVESLRLNIGSEEAMSAVGITAAGGVING